ncbi:hypothetical protein SPRG_02137 [Saprolegnia parasitica CBS 223.65]|uniref:PHD-type domain-containing protein n=1 Tax=Saprolegnia parasitica (strain CBS 223.65) TaxID=695850 RepID=A0A067CRK4_SAPPC|nr:hypothetical protein SPRG_02137 [Saprolegnia parasitica CBS 223.65]KDO33329.1 hypothetical protein SPRG_02137 [Saprolegnia parasitica CBS 223.65]|eukprot:XP_012196078.1 hypothetical protein SPRG_02137 [Saprolegnia parasitica CBS 223.65]
MSVRAFDWQAEFAKDERVTAMDQSCLTIRRWLKRAKREGNASSRDTATSATVPSAPGSNPALAEAADQSIDVKLAAAPSVEPAALAPIDSANQQIDIDMGLSDGMASTCHLRESQAGDQDVDMEEGENDCPLCKEDRDDSDSLLCDTCDQVYHTYCVGLYAVPKDNWFCPVCAPAHETPSSRCAPEQLFKELQELNGMLVHACSCDAAACTDATFSATCKPMKLALQCMSWLSFNADIRPTSFIEHLAKLLAFHAAHCAVGDTCLVPLCHTLRLQGA